MHSLLAHDRSPWFQAGSVALLLSLCSCEKSQPQQTDVDRPPSAATVGGSSSPAAKPDSKSTRRAVTDPPSASAEVEENDTLTLAGIVMTIPEGWTRKPTSGGAMAPVAVLELPAGDGDGPASVRITHFPGMKGMNDANIGRWVGQVKGPDGQPMKREDAKVTTRTVGGATLTLVDVSGKVTAGDMLLTGAAGIDNGRLIAVIVDHPKGPHFIKISGPASTLDSQSESITAFLDSVKVQPG